MVSLKITRPEDPEELEVLLSWVRVAAGGCFFLGYSFLIGSIVLLIGEVMGIDRGRHFAIGSDLDWAFAGCLLSCFVCGVGSLLQQVGEGLARDLTVALEYRSRLLREAEMARRQPMLTGGDRERFARKHYLRIVRKGARTRAEHETLYANDAWIGYVKTHLNSGGREILAWYDYEVSLLNLAESFDANVSREEEKLAIAREKAMQDLSATKILALGEQEIASEVDERRLAAQKRLELLAGSEPWREEM